MNRTTERRLRMIERGASPEQSIPVFSRGPADFEAAFQRKVAYGLCEPADRARAFSWIDERFAKQRQALNTALTRWLVNGERFERIEFPRDFCDNYCDFGELGGWAA